MKQPTAPLYPELSTEDGQNYRLQKISEIENQLKAERNARKALYKKYKLELVFVKHYAPNCLTLTLFDSNTA